MRLAAAQLVSCCLSKAFGFPLHCTMTRNNGLNKQWNRTSANAIFKKTCEKRFVMHWSTVLVIRLPFCMKFYVTSPRRPVKSLRRIAKNQMQRYLLVYCLSESIQTSTSGDVFIGSIARSDGELCPKLPQNPKPFGFAQ